MWVLPFSYVFYLTLQACAHPALRRNSGFGWSLAFPEGFFCFLRVASGQEMHLMFLGNQDLSQDEPLLQAPQPQQGQAMDITLSIPRGHVNKKHVGADCGFSQVFAREQEKRRLPHQPLHPQGEDLLSSVNTSLGRRGHLYDTHTQGKVCLLCAMPRFTEIPLSPLLTMDNLLPHRSVFSRRF